MKGVTAEIKQRGIPESLGVPGSDDGMATASLPGVCALCGIPSLVRLCDRLLSICPKACDSSLSCLLIVQHVLAYLSGSAAMLETLLTVGCGSAWVGVVKMLIEDLWSGRKAFVGVKGSA